MSAERLDRSLVSRGLAPSRSRAAQLIDAGAVTVDGVVVTKASAQTGASQRISLREQDPWVSRAAHKLLGALQEWPEITVKDRRCLDAGASTGGFTQVLLSRGAQRVVAVDVGHGQLAEPVRRDPRVENREGLNLRHLEPGQLGEPFDLTVGDLSFISLRLVMASLAQQAAPGGDLLLMVKPQFEVGRERLPRTGVVISARQRREAVAGAARAAEEQGLQVVAVRPSPLHGQDGNREFFLRLQAPAATVSGLAESPSSPGQSLLVEGIPLSPAAADRVGEAEYRD